MTSPKPTDSCLTPTQRRDTPSAYQVCPGCTAKWFTAHPLDHCPRCGAPLPQSDVVATPPWRAARQGLPPSTKDHPTAEMRVTHHIHDPNHGATQ
jgi:hypothetical protein